MTDIDELLGRLRKLEAIELEPRFSRSVQRRGRERLLAGTRNSLLAWGAVLATVVIYLGWAVHFANALYR